MGGIKSVDDKETAVLIGVITKQQDEKVSEEYLNELAFLIDTAGGTEEKRFQQRLQFPHPKTFLGTGKIQEVATYVKENNIDMIVCDDELSPSQIRNLERIFEDKKVLDRNNLILDIFAKRAQTAHAKAQVELAQYEYLLPRLTRMWTHLERQKGGIGMRGPGETEIETDRRIIRDKISLLKKRLKEIDKQKATQRQNRGKMVRVALVGYTNVGKSTLMNVLSKSDVFAEDKLFATLDTTVRKVVVENIPFLLSDTVGFIRKLPHQLIESFKSTLDEVREADLLVHVVDISHSNYEDQMNSVTNTLTEIGASDKPSITVFNKIDLYTFRGEGEFDYTGNTKFNVSLEDLQKSYMAIENDKAIFISATKKENLIELRKLLYNTVREVHITRFPYNDFLYQKFE